MSESAYKKKLEWHRCFNTRKAASRKRNRIARASRQANRRGK